MSTGIRLRDAQIARCHARARADRWNVPRDTFAGTLTASVARWAGDRAVDSREIDRYLDGLHAEDLALACACMRGHDEAWEHVVTTVRPALYRAADALDPTGGARDLADSLYADLFGTPDAEGRRRSLFRYFHGRSSLATWLRAVLAQRQVDRLRATRRLDPLPEEDALADAPADPPASAPERARFLEAVRAVLAATIAALAPRDRLRLGWYYAQDMTLAEIGRALGEHEATVSRHLARARKTIRDDTTRRLRERGFSDAALAEGFRSVIDDAGALDLREWLGSEPARKPLRQDRSTT